MERNEFAQITNEVSIVELLTRAIEYKGEIWETDIQGQRSVFEIVDYRIDLETKKIHFTLEGINPIKELSEFYVRLRYRTTIFKVPISQGVIVSHNEMSCPIPKSLMALKLRPSDRYLFARDDQVSLNLKRLARTQIELVTGLEVRIIDASIGGFGIQISAANAEYLQAEDHIWIRAINQKDLTPEIFGRVLYIRHYGKGLHRTVRAGLQLNRPLEWGVLEKLRSISYKTLSA